jgi:hypothetical protein
MTLVEILIFVAIVGLLIAKRFGDGKGFIDRRANNEPWSLHLLSEIGVPMGALRLICNAAVDTFLVCYSNQCNEALD